MVIILFKIIYKYFFSNLFFTENEPPILPKRRNYSQQRGKEMEFKPCMKMVKPETDMKTKKESLKIIRPTFAEGKGRPERRHYFTEKEKHFQILQNKDLDTNNKVILGEEFKVLNKIGFSKKSLENLPNNKLLSVNFSKGEF